MFNAARYPLGRLAQLASVYIRGKHKPNFNPQSPDGGDHVVIVNAAHLRTTGNKLHQKKYRYHTQYFSGLKETNMKGLVEKDPAKIFYLAVKGMMPPNKLREIQLRQKLIIHAGPYHTQYAQMLPQFTESQPLDINEHLDLHNTSDPNHWRIEFETHPENRPEELKDL